MKKSLLALAVAALAATSIASTASATTVYDKDGTSLAVYGRVQSVFYSDKTGNVSDDKGDGQEATVKTSGRLGFDLRSQLNPSVAAFAKAEFEMSNGDNVTDGKSGKDSDNFMARLLWVGFDFGNAGQVKIGKFEPAIKYAISQTDIFDDWGCAGLAGNDDRREGVVNYQWSGYGVDVIASYVFAKDNEHVDGAYFADENVDMENTVSFAVGYTSPDVVFGPIAVRAGYEMGNFADADTNKNNIVYVKDFINPDTKVNTGLGYDKYNQFAIGLSWGSLNQGPYVGALYQQRKFDLVSLKGFNEESGDYTVKGYEFAAGYNFGNGLLARIGYSNQNIEFDGGDDDVKASTIQAYVNYNFNPQVQVWAEARFDAGTDDEDINPVDVLNGGSINNFAYYAGGNYAENVFSAGVRYNF